LEIFAAEIMGCGEIEQRIPCLVGRVLGSLGPGVLETVFRLFMSVQQNPV
jgi:hypothetical protein